MKRTLIILLLLALTGCGSLQVSTRVGCTLAKDEMLSVTKLGPIRIATSVDDRDREAACADKAPAPAAVAPAAAASAAKKK